jgi:hypothetical protein
VPKQPRSKDEALKLALEFVEANHSGGPDAFELITSIKQALSDAAHLAAPVPDIPDLIAGALGVSRGTAYDLMREALKEAAPVQEPVLWLVNGVVQASDIPTNYTGCLYTTPPNVATPLDETASLAAPAPEERKRQSARSAWVGLTDEEMYLNCPNWLSQEQCKVWIQQIEAKLKEKNSD